MHPLERLASAEWGDEDTESNLYPIYSRKINIFPVVSASEDRSGVTKFQQCADAEILVHEGFQMLRAFVWYPTASKFSAPINLKLVSPRVFSLASAILFVQPPYRENAVVFFSPVGGPRQ